MENAFNIIYKEYSYLVFYVSLQIVKDNDIAKDITNETFYKFYANKDNIDSGKNIKYYLTTISKNLSLNYLSSIKHEEPLDENVMYNDEKKNHFNDYIEKFKDFLDQEEIDLIVYHLLYGFTFKDLAILKNASIDAISSKYRRTLIKIRKNYKKG
jgi:RNA polymerase sigma-70 factor (ECF subfamily)